jgi:hypothetical protein
MTFGALWAFLAIALPVLAALLANLSSVDLAYHLRAGALFLDTGRIPTTDTFTFTAAGEPWLNQQWAAQVLFALVERAAGWSGLVVLRAALVGTFAALVYVASRRQGLAVRPAAWLTLAAFALAAVALALRPQLVGMVLFALVLLLVVERRRHPRLLWLVPVVVLVWANVHGSFFLGPAVLAAAWIADLADRSPAAPRTLLVAVVAAAAALVNPFGAGVWTYAAGLSTNPLVTERITEWQPTSLRTIPGLAFFASALGVAAILARRGRVTPWPALAWFAAFFVIGAWAIRGVAWWPPAAAVGIAGLLGSGFLGSGAIEPAEPERLERARPLNRVLAIVLVLAGAALLPIWRPTDVGLGTPTGVVGNAPPGITADLRSFAGAGDRILAPQPWGSWFEYAVPEAAVAVDSRIELFGVDVWQGYDEATTGRPGWREVLDRWGVTVIVATEERERGLLVRLDAPDSGWTRRFADADGTVYVRADRS